MKKAVPFRVFEPVLVISDLLCAMGAFGAGLWLSGWYANTGLDDPEGTAGLVILGIITISFFPTFRLYSHHVLFSKKQHLKNLIKSFFWSALTLGIVLLLFNSSDLLQRNYYYFLLMLVLSALELSSSAGFLEQISLIFSCLSGLPFFL